jgi:Tfp pilus assembly protein PilN
VRPVNLLPARYRPRTGGSGDSKTAYLALGVLAVLALAVFGYVMTAKKADSRNAEIAAARQQIEAAETQAVTLQGFGDFAGVKEARLSSVKTLATTRLDWERLFRELAHVLPERVWLTEFDAQVGSTDGGADTGPTMILSGCADSHEKIADAMIRLRELHVAEDVELTETSAGEEEEAAAALPPGAATDGGEDGCGRFYTFGVSVTLSVPTGFEEPDTGTVPARLGGGG